MYFKNNIFVDPVKVSVIIPCRNEVTHITATIKNLLNQDLENLKVEFLVADGMSDDGTRVILSDLSNRHPQFRVIDNPKKIVSTGLNRAIEQSKGDIIIRMDAHTSYAPNYISQCVKTLQLTNAANVGGPWQARGNSTIQQAIAMVFQSPFSSGGALSHSVDYEGEVDSVYLGCWKRDTLLSIGGFDENLVRNQDDELNLRLRRSNLIIWQSPEIQSWYLPRASYTGLFRQYFQYGYWKVPVMKKHHLPASIRHIIPALFVFTIGILSLSSPWFSVSFRLLVILIGFYLTALFVSSIISGRKKAFIIPYLIPAFSCFHFGYGIGFLVGLVDFIFLGRSRISASKLTR